MGSKFINLTFESICMTSFQIRPIRNSNKSSLEKKFKLYSLVQTKLRQWVVKFGPTRISKII